MGYTLSKQGKLEMDKLRRKKKWSKYDHQWCRKTGVSESTLKRFWGAINDGGVSESTFIAICEAAGLEDVAEKWHWLVEQEKIDSTHNNTLNSLDDIKIIDPNTEFPLLTPFTPPNSAFTLRVRCQISLTQPEQDLITLILEDLQDNLLNEPCYARLTPQNSPITSSSEAPQIPCNLNISGYVSPDNQASVDAVLEELKDYTSMDDAVILWKTPENQNS